jgi:hypothetical protein
MRVQPSTPISRLSLGLALACVCVPACGGGGGSGGGSSGSSFVIVEASNGFGKLLPHQIAVRDAQGLPTSQVIELTRFEQLIENATLTNPIKPPTEWPLGAKLPNGKAGNHFIFARFSQPLDPTSVLSRDTSDPPGTPAGGIQVQGIDTITGAITNFVGRAFVGGQTFGPDSSGGLYVLQTWVTDNAGVLQADTIGGGTPGLGFPGTEPDTSFAGDTTLVEPETFVFVLDQDGDLTTHETFPAGQPIQMRIGSSVRSARGKVIDAVGLASSTVGDDTIAPEVQVAESDQSPMVVPADLAENVDPQTNITVQFTEPIQVLTLGDLDDGTPPFVSAAVRLGFGPANARVQVPFTVRPFSMYDLTRFELVPVYDFPGTGPTLPGVPCENLFGTIDVSFNTAQFRDLSIHGPDDAGNKNTLAPSSTFTTREGPGIVNAPVTPDVIYVGRTGSRQGISVIDLNGFGGGTGNPIYDRDKPATAGNSNYPNNPNVALQGALMIPPLSQGTCTFNGGSSGVFTLTKDTSLQDLVATAPLLESVGDMAIGHALDNTFSNESPFGCQSGGGNICAGNGLKRISIVSGGPNTIASANFIPIPPLKTDPGVENLASWAPHPNPPPLVFPPLCLSPLINGLEPTAIDTSCPLPPLSCVSQFGPPHVARSGPQLTNQLTPADNYLGIPAFDIPPSGLVAEEQNTWFEGPSLPQPQIGLCEPYMMRQQVGHFLYVIDRVASEIVVFNSNRFTVLDRIRFLDPTSLAMSPNLDFLAVTNEGADLVAFLDIDPSSPTFHQVVKATTVGTGPTGIAWDSANEDIFVCNQGEGTVSLISGFTLDVRKTLRNQISRPVEVALTPRQFAFGFARGVYFGYILNQNGNVAFFESGPDGINGFGFDDIIGSLPFKFRRPKAMQVDPTNLNSAVWIVHENPLDELGNDSGQGGGAVSNVGISGGLPGIIPLDPGPFVSPQIRELEFSVLASFGFGPRGLSGIPVDIAFDDMRNLSALTNYGTTFSPGNPLSYNGKSLIKVLGAAAISVTAPQFMFVAIPNPGVIDVFDMTSGSFERVDTNPHVAGFQGITAPNATILADYFRQ